MKVFFEKICFSPTISHFCIGSCIIIACAYRLRSIFVDEDFKYFAAEFENIGKNNRFLETRQAREWSKKRDL